MHRIHKTPITLDFFAMLGYNALSLLMASNSSTKKNSSANRTMGHIGLFGVDDFISHEAGRELFDDSKSAQQDFGFACKLAAVNDMMNGPCYSSSYSSSQLLSGPTSPSRPGPGGMYSTPASGRVQSSWMDEYRKTTKEVLLAACIKINQAIDDHQPHLVRNKFNHFAGAKFDVEFIALMRSMRLNETVLEYMDSMNADIHRVFFIKEKKFDACNPYRDLLEIILQLLENRETFAKDRSELCKLDAAIANNIKTFREANNFDIEQVQGRYIPSGQMF